MNSEAGDAAGAEVLIVEDSTTQALKLEHTLRRHGYRVHAARNGREALVKLESYMPRLVITDINMPEMNGYELCQKIKADAQLKDLPVILLTSLSDPKDILKGLECGADNFISKPYDDEFLLSRIHYVLVNQELRRGGGPEGTEIFFAGRKYRLTTDRIHSIDLLLSTYETAVQKNLELTKAKAQLEQQAEELREKNAEMEADLNMARELQVAFLPQHYPTFPPSASPSESALRFCHRYTTTAELGGDFFDVFVLSETQAGVLICDVMGHGVRAALVTAIVRGLVEELAPIAAEPGRFLTEVNSSLTTILKQTLTPLFASAFYLVVDVSTGLARFASAGHPSPFHVRRDRNEVSVLMTDEQKPGSALGVFEEANYSTFETRLAAGDLVLLFTDGIYEVEGADQNYYDLHQLRDAVARRSNLLASEMFDELLGEIRQFAGGRDFEDDVCLLGVEVVRIGS